MILAKQTEDRASYHGPGDGGSEFEPSPSRIVRSAKQSGSRRVEVGPRGEFHQARFDADPLSVAFASGLPELSRKLDMQTLANRAQEELHGEDIQHEPLHVYGVDNTNYNKTSHRFASSTTNDKDVRNVALNVVPTAEHHPANGQDFNDLSMLSDGGERVSEVEDDSFFPGLLKGISKGGASSLAYRGMDMMLGTTGIIDEDYPFACICNQQGLCDMDQMNTPCPQRAGLMASARRSTASSCLSTIALMLVALCSSGNV